jgi:hypothetical protein
MKLGRVYTLEDTIRDRKTLGVRLLVTSPGAIGPSIRLVLTHDSHPPTLAETQLPIGSVSQTFCHGELLAG